MINDGLTLTNQKGENRILKKKTKDPYKLG